MSSPLTRRILDEYQGTAAAQAGAAAASRRAALAILETQGLPSSRDENWKYANLRSLERQRFVPPPPTASTASLAVSLPAMLPGYRRYVFVDGAFAPALSAAPDQAVTTGSAAGEAAGADERLALLNQAFATDGASIRVEAADAPSCIELDFVAHADAAAGASYPRIAVELAAGARATIIERHVSASQVPNFVNAAVGVRVGHGAQLEHLRLQDLNARSTLFDTLSAELATASSYRLHAITTGARASRSTLTARLNGRQAQFELAAVSLGDAQQLQDTYCVVEHREPEARTLQTFRGIAAGRARVAFNGKVVVAAGARGTDSRQSLRGLLAGPEAEIDVRPQLEIYTDDVRCSHGATAGKLDDTMLFYLLSRGLSRETALRLLKWAFLEDVVAQITLPALRRQIEERIAAQLRDETLQELL